MSNELEQEELIRDALAFARRYLSRVKFPQAHTSIGGKCRECISDDGRHVRMPCMVVQAQALLEKAAWSVNTPPSHDGPGPLEP